MAYDSRIRRAPRSTLGAVECIRLVHVSIKALFPVLRSKYLHRPETEELQGSAQEKGEPRDRAPKENARNGKIKRKREQKLDRLSLKRRRQLSRSKPPFPFIAAPTLVTTLLFAAASLGLVN